MNKIICAVMVALIAVSFASASYAEKDRIPEIHKAIEKLKHANEDLSAGKAGDEYDGYRVRARKHIEEAEKELNDAIEYAKAHPQDEHHDHH